MQKLNEKKLKQRVEETICADIESGKVGGAAVAVMQEGETVYQNYFSDERIGIRVKEDTVFRLASMTKPITAAATLILIGRGEYTLDTPVSHFIPEFQQMEIGQLQQGKVVAVKPAKTPVTVRHLLTHSSGLGSGPVGDCIAAGLPGAKRKKLEQVVGYYAQHPLDFEPFTTQFYSGVHGFDVLARIVEIVSGMAYDRFLAKELFDPLGMKDTTFSPTEEQWKRMIPMHNYVEDPRHPEQKGISRTEACPQGCIFEDFPTPYFAGGAGLASTLSDYKKFASMLLRYGNADGKQIIREELIREMATPQLPREIMPDPEIWGLGVRVITGKEYQDLPVGTFGWSGAYGTHFWVDPVNRVTAVYMKNSRYDGGAGALTSRQFERDVNSAFE